MTAGTGSGSGIFVGVDRALFAAAFGDRLRRSGIDVTFTAIERCAAAIGAVGALSVSDTYWVCRVSFVTRERDVARFDEVFRALFGVEFGRLPGQQIGPQTRSESTSDERLAPVHRAHDGGAGAVAPLPWATLPSVTMHDAGAAERDDSSADEAVLHERRPSADAIDVDRPFDKLDDDELARIGALLESVETEWPQRRTRRRRTTRAGGAIALRRSVRNAMHTGGDVVRLLRTEPRSRPRRVVVLLDVSGSMESYARVYLHLTRGLAIAHRAEVFAFATRLARVTPMVRARSADEAIDQLSEVVGDRFSGTRLASSLTTLLHHRVWNTTLRGAAVVICSDGWDADDPERLDRAMRRLALLAHRVVWVNPRAAAADFEPLAGGMAAALPYCDHFLAGNTGRSMADVIGAITAA